VVVDPYFFMGLLAGWIGRTQGIQENNLSTKPNFSCSTNQILYLSNFLRELDDDLK
jgi:hypothetical protein